MQDYDSLTLEEQIRLYRLNKATEEIQKPKKQVRLTYSGGIFNSHISYE